jgi:hypothetical protein
VGYIDTAVLADRVWFRYDAAYDNRQPNRAEFIWAWPPPFGGGPPLDETSLDYQDFTAGFELRATEQISGFFEGYARLSNPEVNDNTAGFGDINAGFKVELYSDSLQVATAQFRTYIPTGDEDRGMGTGHVSLEPSLLYLRRIGDRLNVEAEGRYWIPIAGTEGRAGSVLRYGLGASYRAFDWGDMSFAPVAEFVGWSILDGDSRFRASPSDIITRISDGDQITNLKAGIRMNWGMNSLYAGYGRALTGQAWYEDILRIEFRRAF